MTRASQIESALVRSWAAGRCSAAGQYVDVCVYMNSSWYAVSHSTADGCSWLCHCQQPGRILSAAAAVWKDAVTFSSLHTVSSKSHFHETCADHVAQSSAILAHKSTVLSSQSTQAAQHCKPEKTVQQYKHRTRTSYQPPSQQRSS
jgi:hypothetical protein